ncbi:MAG TPA: Gfo/Idh/MocA family oxidoreductase [Ilumatobacter sp.]|nr:Gfo/Idh/MocA family oxidoreductase [Ilumatobacter sp.]
MGEAQLRVGIVGAGFIGAVHARAARLAGARLVGVVASTPARTERAVAALGAERGYASAEALAAADEVDVVHICAPNHLHRPLVAAAVAAGKHVVCEKPLAVDLAGATELHALATSAGVVATVPFVYRFYPMVREARARVLATEQAARLVHGSYLQDWLSTAGDDNWRVDAQAGGRSRAFADIGSHWCDLVEFVTGDRIEQLCGELVTALPERLAGDDLHAFATRAETSAGAPAATSRLVDTEDVALVMFRTRRGATGSVVVSQISSGHKNQLRFEIALPDDTLVFDQEHPDTLWIGRRGPSLLAARDAAHLHPSAASYVRVPPGHPQGYQECFDAFVADTYQAIAAGSADAVDGLPTFADGVRAARITDAVLRSADAHTWVDVGAEPTEPADQPTDQLTGERDR